MRPRIFVSLEPAARVGTIIPGLDDLDIAYACARGGAAGLVVSAPTESIARENLSRFDRPGLPLLCMHASLHQLDELGRLGNVPDRFLISDEGRSVIDFVSVSALVERLAGTHQEVAVLVEPDPQVLKQVIRSRVSWVAFSTENLCHSESRVRADDELLRLSSTVLLARKNGLRVMLYGPVEQHLASSLGAMDGVEEIIPHPTLWQLALRHGWEQSLEVFARWLR